MPRRPILLALMVAAVATITVLVVIRPPAASQRAVVGEAAPPILGATLDGASFDLTTLRGKPVVVNFWASWCIPCRDEFPLFEQVLERHADEGLVLVGVLFEDQPADAANFVARFDAGWSSVPDPQGVIATAYRVVAPPQTYFIDRAGVIQSIQIGELTDADFERQYARIAP
jgi:cytochrome c biogenesis protein CcmG/thiol:disulfide interchange protein DsbE